MIWDERPRVALGLGFFEDESKAVEESPAVLVITENLCPFYPPGHDVLEKAGGV